MERQKGPPGRTGEGNGRRTAPPCRILKGNMHRTLVVKDPGGIYSQAIFILKPEACGQEIGKRELLRQAKEAAGVLLPQAPARSRSALFFLMGVLLGSLCTAGALWGLGIAVFH